MFRSRRALWRVFECSAFGVRLFGLELLFAQRVLIDLEGIEGDEDFRPLRKGHARAGQGWGLCIDHSLQSVRPGVIRFAAVRVIRHSCALQSSDYGLAGWPVA